MALIIWEVVMIQTLSYTSFDMYPILQVLTENEDWRPNLKISLLRVCGACHLHMIGKSKSEVSKRCFGTFPNQ